MFCKKCGKPIGAEDKFCPHCGTPVTDDIPNDIFPPYTPPMKWYKFLIYFSLFAGAIASAIGVVSSLVLILTELGTYLANIPLLAVEIAYAACNLIFACFALYTRNALVKYKKNAPLCLYVCYGISGLSEVVYGAYTYIEGSFDLLSVIVGVITIVAMIAANYIYFTKRKDMFNK